MQGQYESNPEKRKPEDLINMGKVLDLSGDQGPALKPQQDTISHANDQQH